MELASLKIKKLIILSSLSPQRFVPKKFLIFFPKKNSLWKKFLYFLKKKLFLYFGKWNFLIFPEMGLFSLKNIKFQEETFPSYLLAAQTSCFLIHHVLLIQSVRPHLVASPSLGSPCITNRTPCHSIGLQVLPTKLLP